jgi:crossover junction endodeoxyribonuclease RuvC
VFDAEGPVLGIDPGLSGCGYGAVRTRNRALTAVACGVLRTDAGAPLPERLATLEAELERFLAEVRPCALAVERVLFQTNVRTAISVGQASGIALAVAARAGVPVTHYSPNEVKLAVAGDGGAAKTQVQAMTRRLLNLRSAPPADAADALALAVCHLWRTPLQASVARAVAGNPA